MAGTEELMARLSQLEQGYYGDKEAARQKNFFDTYGARFANNRGLGLAVLNELDARGIDTSAADEAVQEILDQLRTECQDILDLLGDVQDAAVQSQKKIDTIADAVQNQVAENPDASVDGGPVPEESVPPVPEEPVPPVPEEQTVSDIRKKRIERMRANWGKTRPMVKKEQQTNSFKPSADMLKALTGGR